MTTTLAEKKKLDVSKIVLLFSILILVVGPQERT
jgi:hypothetical protein